METCAVSALGGVLVGAIVATGVQPRTLVRALGHPQLARLLELLDHLARQPPPVVVHNGSDDDGERPSLAPPSGA